MSGPKLVRLASLVGTLKQMALRDWEVFGARCEPEIVSPRELAIRRVTMTSTRTYDQVSSLFYALERTCGLTYQQIETHIDQLEQLPLQALQQETRRFYLGAVEYCEHIGDELPRHMHRSEAARNAYLQRKAK